MNRVKIYFGFSSIEVQNLVLNLLYSLAVNNIFTKRCQGQTCKLEVLAGKGNTDDGNEKQEPKNDVNKRCVYSATYNPDDVE